MGFSFSLPSWWEDYVLPRFGFIQGASSSFVSFGRMGSSISCASELAIGISVSAFGAAILSSF
jgi:hypothetical protein